MDTITVEIDVTTPKGRKIVRDLAENRKYVKIQNPSADETWYDWDSVWEELIEDMSNHYNVDMKSLISECEKNDL